jgi:hypothetical protein
LIKNPALTSEDSNSHIPDCKKPFKMSREFQTISLKSSLETFGTIVPTFGSAGDLIAALACGIACHRERNALVSREEAAMLPSPTGVCTTTRGDGQILESGQTPFVSLLKISPFAWVLGG